MVSNLEKIKKYILRIFLLRFCLFFRGILFVINYSIYKFKWNIVFNVIYYVIICNVIFGLFNCKLYKLMLEIEIVDVE